VVADAATARPPASVSVTEAACATRHANWPSEGAANVAVAEAGAGAGAGAGGGEDPPPQAASVAARDIIEPMRASSRLRGCEMLLFKRILPEVLVSAGRRSSL